MSEIAQPKFGRRFAPDARDAAFNIRRALDPIRGEFPHGVPKVTTRHYPTGPVLDQGRTGTCTAHGMTARINSAPIMQKMPMSPFDFYRLVVGRDEFTDNDDEANAPDADLQMGTTVRATAKAAKDLGLFESYLWTGDVEDVRLWHLFGKGGMLAGIDWKSNMMTTDSDGFVSYSGSVDGGHCFATKGWSDAVKRHGRLVRAVRCQQSWGGRWGQHGFFWIEADEFQHALNDQGEMCAPTELKLKASK